MLRQAQRQAAAGRHMIDIPSLIESVRAWQCREYLHLNGVNGSGQDGRPHALRSFCGSTGDGMRDRLIGSRFTLKLTVGVQGQRGWVC